MNHSTDNELLLFEQKTLKVFNGSTIVPKSTIERVPKLSPLSPKLKTITREQFSRERRIIMMSSSSHQSITIVDES